MHPSYRRSSAIKQLRRVALVALAALPVLGCSDGVTGPSDLRGGVWRLQSMRLAGASSSFVPADPSRYTVEFKSDGLIGVRADCNSCGGSYSLSGDRLQVPDMVCTLMACSDANGGEFANLIAGVSTVDKDADDVIRVGSPDGTLTLVR